MGGNGNHKVKDLMPLFRKMIENMYDDKGKQEGSLGACEDEQSDYYFEWAYQT